MWVLTLIRDLLPCEDPVIPVTRVSTLMGIWVSGRLLTRPGPHADTGSGTQPPAHIQRQIHHKHHCVSALKMYFWGNYFLNIVEYTGNLQGNNAFETLFFFLRKGLVYLLCSVFLNNLWTSPTDLPPLASSLAARLG